MKVDMESFKMSGCTHSSNNLFRNYGHLKIVKKREFDGRARFHSFSPFLYRDFLVPPQKVLFGQKFVFLTSDLDSPVNSV